jgi:hypothetical protein
MQENDIITHHMTDDELINGIHLAVVGATAAFLQKYPVLRRILSKSQRPKNDWDFYMTVAGLGVYYLRHKVSPHRHSALMAAISQFDRQMPEGLSNLYGYFASHTDANIDSRIKVGFWVLWNIAGEPPTQEESRDLAPAIGVYLDRVVTDLATE